jgi:hypothetical protein
MQNKPGGHKDRNSDECDRWLDSALLHMNRSKGLNCKETEQWGPEAYIIYAEDRNAIVDTASRPFSSILFTWLFL